MFIASLLGKLSHPIAVIYVEVWMKEMEISKAVDVFLFSMKAVKSTKTIAWYRWTLSSLSQHLAGVDIGEISTHDLRHWRAELVDRDYRFRSDQCSRPEVEGGLSTDTLRGYVRSARRFFNWLIEEGHLENSPAQRLEMPPKTKRAKKGIADGDRKKMLAAASENLRDYSLAKFIDATGCREAGAAGLKLDDLDLDELKATVYEKGRGGNNKGRNVFYLTDTAVVLREFIEQYPPIDGRVFGLKGSGIYQVFKRLAKKAGVKKRWSPHQWRHACGRRWTQAGMPLGVVSQLMGHEDPSVTVEFYGQFTNGELQDLHRRYTSPS